MDPTPTHRLSTSYPITGEVWWVDPSMSQDGSEAVAAPRISGTAVGRIVAQRLPAYRARIVR
jgi:hypothetical protein